jgi:DNA-binding winged helix-turn-helix (wHTH) protein
MPTTAMVQFETDPELGNGEKQAVALRPKSLAVLRYLMKHAGRVVGKEELLVACWPEVKVGAAALKVCIREIRIALGDQAKIPRFIETLPREGYRWIGKGVRSQYSVVLVNHDIVRSFSNKL